MSRRIEATSRAGVRGSPRRRRGGFTLLEVLVALTILGVALGASMRAAMSLTDNARDTRLKLLATMAAENRLLELRLARATLGIGTSEVDCAQGGVVFRCAQSVQGTPNPFFRRVEVRVLHGEAEAARRYAEFTIVLRVNP